MSERHIYDVINDAVNRTRYLLEWVPICSIGSSGYLRRVAVEKSIEELEHIKKLLLQVNVS